MSRGSHNFQYLLYWKAFSTRHILIKNKTREWETENPLFESLRLSHFCGYLASLARQLDRQPRDCCLVGMLASWLGGCHWVMETHYTEATEKAWTWLGEISSCSCLTYLPGTAWILLSKIYKPFPGSLYKSIFLILMRLLVLWFKLGQFLERVCISFRTAQTVHFYKPIPLMRPLLIDRGEPLQSLPDIVTASVLCQNSHNI